MTVSKTTIKVGALLFLLMFLQSCTVSLAPQYNERLHDSLSEFNIEVLTFLASNSAGKTDECNTRLPVYATLIGQAEANALMSRARPMPENATLEKIYAKLEERGIAVGALDEAPSAAALDSIASTLVKMRETDCSRGLAVVVVAAFKNQIMISLDQALTYEAFLER